jgi:hypothetical protein
MNSTGFEPPTSRAPQWRDWTWQPHPLIWIYPAAMLVVAAPFGASGLAQETARILCWISAIGVQVLLCPRRPQLFDAGDPSSRMRVWPLGLWHDGFFVNLWRLNDSGTGRIFLPIVGNAVVALTSALILGILSVQMTWNPFVSAGPWNLEGQAIAPWSGLWWLGQVGHAHWVLTLAAMIPAMPLAGGLGLALILDQLQWRDPEARQIRRIVSYASIAFLAILGAMLVANGHDGGYCVILVALVMGIEARKQMRRDATETFIENFVLGVIDEEDFEEGLDRLETRKDNFRGRLRDWLAERKRERASETQRRLRLRTIQDEERLDRVLESIHAAGIESLPWSDRRFLKRIARNYRSRREEDRADPKR